MALVFNPAPIRGLGTTGGFEVYVQTGWMAIRKS